MSAVNVWTVLWQSPDGKPFSYKRSPKGRPIKDTHARFEVSEVQKYQNMVLWHLPDAKFRCLSNVDVPGVEVVPLEDSELVGWFAKYELWRPGLPEGRNVYFDLDTLLIRGIDGIANYPAPFAIAPGMSGFERRGAKPWQDQEGRWRVPGYQGSCIVWDTEQAARIWNRFVEAKDDFLTRLASEQDFLGEQFPNEARMPREWFGKLLRVMDSPRPDLRVCLTMMAHNEGAAQQYEWARKIWN